MIDEAGIKLDQRGAVANFGIGGVCTVNAADTD